MKAPQVHNPNYSMQGYLPPGTHSPNLAQIHQGYAQTTLTNKPGVLYNVKKNPNGPLEIQTSRNHPRSLDRYVIESGPQGGR